MSAVDSVSNLIACPAVPADGNAVPLGDEIVLDSHRQVFFVLDDQDVLFVRHERQFSRQTVADKGPCDRFRTL